MDYVVYIVLIVGSLGAVGLNVLGLPGNWGMMAAAVMVSWATGWDHPGVLALVLMGLVLGVGEIVEFVAVLVGAKGFGASRGAMWAALFGGLLGAVVGVPVPIVGTIVGAVLGSFLGAFVWELGWDRPVKASLWAAVGAALGRTIGLAAKVSCGLVVWGALLFCAWPG